VSNYVPEVIYRFFYFTLSVICILALCTSFSGVYGQNSFPIILRPSKKMEQFKHRHFSDHHRYAASHSHPAKKSGLIRVRTEFAEPIEAKNMLLKPFISC